MIVDAFILSYKREDYLERVIKGAKRQSFVRDIFLIHNYPSKKKIKGVINIFFEKNFKCMARHIVSFLSDCDYALFIDDDIELLTDFSDRFKYAVRKFPNSIVGVFGCDIDADHKGKKSLYASGGYYFESDFYRVVDIAVGRVLFAPKTAIRSYVNNGLYFKYPFSDDVVLNLANQIENKKPSLIIKSSVKEHIDLTEKYAVCSRDSHYMERSEIIYNAMKKGWRSLRKKYRLPEMKSKSFEKYISKAKSLFDEGNVDLAWEFLKKRDKLYWNYGLCKLAYNCASFFHNSGMYSKAKKMYKILSLPGKSYPQIIGLSQFKLGMIYLSKGDKAKAERHFKNCLYFYPSHKKAKKIVGAN